MDDICAWCEAAACFQVKLAALRRSTLRFPRGFPSNRPGESDPAQKQSQADVLLQQVAGPTSEGQFRTQLSHPALRDPKKRKRNTGDSERLGRLGC